MRNQGLRSKYCDPGFKQEINNGSKICVNYQILMKNICEREEHLA